MIGLQISMAPLPLERRYQPLFDGCLFTGPRSARSRVDCVFLTSSKCALHDNTFSKRKHVIDGMDDGRMGITCWLYTNLGIMIVLTVTRRMNSDEQEHDAFVLWIDQLYKKKSKKRKKGKYKNEEKNE